MLKWIKHSWVEERGDPENGPGPSLMDEYDGVTGVEIVNGRASAVVTLGGRNLHVSGEGVLDLEELTRAQRWISTLESLRNEMDAWQEDEIYDPSELDDMAAIWAVEDRLLREAVEIVVAAEQDAEFLCSANGFKVLPTRFFGIACVACWDLKHRGEFAGVIRRNSSTGLWAAIPLPEMVKDETTFEYRFRSDEDACVHLRSWYSAVPVDELAEMIRGSDMLIER